MSFVENSGMCETTPGVNRFSGYFSVGEGLKMWFCSQESSRGTASSVIRRRPGGWQQVRAVHATWTVSFSRQQDDTPIGAGFSYGAVFVYGTKAAAPYVWTLLQVFYDSFPEYQYRDFAQ
ncbi:hypothetical protein GGR53DRAFT_471851 [Hypoxylon sp. FL1150]|nr:hypothetical protein GGR53DRAFT_471851 [Hypoxylon sp. FL1150]